MIRHTITVINPGIVNIGGDAAYERQYAADILVEPPVRIGPDLARFIGGAAGSIAISDIASTSEMSHIAVATTRGRHAAPESVAQAVDRIVKYFNTEPSQLGELGMEYAKWPIVARSLRQA